MAHVGVEGLAAGHHQKHGPQRGDAGKAVPLEEIDGVPGIECVEDRRRADDPHDAERGDTQKPDDHDRAEQATDPVGAELLDHEQHDQDRHGNRHDVWAEQRRHHLEAFHGAEHRDRRRNHAVAVEQGRPEDPERDEQRAADREPCAGIAVTARNERGKREDTAFALVVGPHHDGDVFDGDDDDQGVDDEREDAEDVVVRRRYGVRSEETLANRVEHAGADVAIDDAECGERQRKQVAAVGGAGGKRSARRRQRLGHERSSIISVPVCASHDG